MTAQPKDTSKPIPPNTGHGPSHSVCVLPLSSVTTSESKPETRTAVAKPTRKLKTHEPIDDVDDSERIAFVKDEDYDFFMQSLWKDGVLDDPQFDDEDEFEVSGDIEDDDDDDDVLTVSQTQVPKPATPGPAPTDELDSNFYQELAEELGWLQEEDMEAAVATLLEQPEGLGEGSPKLSLPSGSTPSPARSPLATESSTAAPAVGGPWKSESPPKSTPLREASRAGTSRVEVTRIQYTKLQQLLMQHYQLLMQQCILAASHAQAASSTSSPSSGLNADALVEVLDASVGMLQDLDRNRRDSIRYWIQFCESKDERGSHASPRRSLFGKGTRAALVAASAGPQRLTRAQFSKTLQQHSDPSHLRTVFDIRGLESLQKTFVKIDETSGCSSVSTRSSCQSCISLSYCLTCDHRV